jgi:hypothetical protein
VTVREEFYSKVELDKLLHIVYRGSWEPSVARVDIVPEEHFIQCSHLNFNKGKTFRAHKHIWKGGSMQVIAQESWVVLTGKIKVTLYDLDNTVLAQPILDAHDASFTLEGGHTYEILEDNTVIYEFKTGPYKGIELDKEFIDG